MLLLEQRLRPALNSPIDTVDPRPRIPHRLLRQVVPPRPPKADFLLGEDAIDILELQALGLGVEDVDDGDPRRVQDGEDDIGLPADVLDRRRRDLDDEEVADPVARRRDGRPALAQPQRQDLRRIDPDGGLEANRKRALEDEEHGGGALAGEAGGAGVVLDLVDEGGLDGHDGGHEGDHAEEEGPAADAVDEQPRDEGGDEEPGLQEAGHEA